jgi:hypothetical protein
VWAKLGSVSFHSVHCTLVLKQHAYLTRPECFSLTVVMVTFSGSIYLAWLVKRWFLACSSLLQLLSFISEHYTMSVQNIKNTFLILCTPSPQPEYVVAWTLQGVERIPQGCWPMSTPIILTVVKLAGCPLSGGPLLSMKNPSSVPVLDTNRCLATTTIPLSKALTSFVLPIQPLNGTHTQSIGAAG